MEQKMKESQSSKKITEKNSAPEVLEELAKIPQEIIDKENAQKYIEWRFFKSEVIGFIIGTIIFLIVGSFFFFIGIYNVHELFRKGLRAGEDAIIWSFGVFLILSLAIVAYIYAAIDLYFRYRVLKRKKRKNSD
jgi:hypothetical protein